MRGDYLSRFELERVFSEVANAILQIIKSSELSLAEREDLQRAIATIPVHIRDVGRVQSRHLRNGANEAGTRPVRARSKRKTVAEADD